MNLSEALAHVAAHRAAGTLDQLDAEIGYVPEARRLWTGITHLRRGSRKP